MSCSIEKSYYDATLRLYLFKKKKLELLLLKTLTSIDKNQAKIVDIHSLQSDRLYHQNEESLETI